MSRQKRLHPVNPFIATSLSTSKQTGSRKRTTAIDKMTILHNIVFPVYKEVCGIPELHYRRRLELANVEKSARGRKGCSFEGDSIAEL